MLLSASFFILLVFYSVAGEVTFQNVTFRGYSMYTEKFKKTIPSSNKLAGFLPNSVYDKIEFQEQNIPVIYAKALSELKYLDELVIENCNVTNIHPNALENNPFMRRLSLKGNKLEEIKSDVFNNQELSVLDLSKNDISTIESGAFDHMPNLLHINLADNKIRSWNPLWFHDTPLLNRISMQNNSLVSLPSGAFENLKGFKSFGKLKFSISLVLSYNQIKTIDPQAFESLTDIHNLWLDHNNLENFSDLLLENISIDDLRLDHNNIKCLNGDLKKLFKAQSTHIDSNPFDCECLESIKVYVKNNSKEVDFFFADMECIAQGIKTKMNAVEKRLKEIGNKDEKEDDEVNSYLVTSNNPIK